MKKIILIIPLLCLLSACQFAVTGSETIPVSITVNGSNETVNAPKDATVQQALKLANIELENLDRVEPSAATVVTSGMQIKVIRVVEEFNTVETVLPFENQTVKNESMPDGQKMLIQPGVNGKISTTYRVIKEDGIPVSKTIVKTDTLEEAVPEIIMIGVQSPFVSQLIEGRLAYITSSSAWLMEANTGNRRPLVTSGDLDGRIFSVSPDRNWLLFSRSSAAAQKSSAINSLWVIQLNGSDSKPIALGVENVVHYAEWVPGKTQTIAYSTVEPRDIPPGWQANNDLNVLEFDSEGNAVKKDTLVDINSGGIYGWWGTIFSFSPDGTAIAYARPDGIGLVNIKEGKLEPLLSLVPYQTGGDWAWVPGLSWAPKDQILFTVLHGPAGGTHGDETSTEFDLAAIVVASDTVIRLVPNAGMFAYPRLSAAQADGTYQLGVLTSILPGQSETSKYDLRLMDRDGSNIRKLYPGEGIQGLNPQQIVWSPQSTENKGATLGFLSQGNIMLINVATGSISQVSGDGTVSKIDWK